MSAFNELLDAVRSERDQLVREADELKEKLDATRAEIKRYDRVLGAGENGAGPTGLKPVKRKKRDTNDWSVSEKMLDELYAKMANGLQTEYTAGDLEEAAGVSYTTAVKGLRTLHEQGRVRLVRTQGPGNKKVWRAVV